MLIFEFGLTIYSIDRILVKIVAGQLGWAKLSHAVKMGQFMLGIQIKLRKFCPQIGIEIHDKWVCWIIY